MNNENKSLYFELKVYKAESHDFLFSQSFGTMDEVNCFVAGMKTMINLWGHDECLAFFVDRHTKDDVTMLVDIDGLVVKSFSKLRLN